ncbi:MAG: PcfJ domain-containing protein [Ottowia sp.]|nr:PcfJ domain-containing protein [Ottowia sp.]
MTLKESSSVTNVHNHFSSCDFGVVADGMVVAAKTGKKARRKSFGGRDDLLNVYRLAKNFIIKHKIFRICQVVENQDVKQLTICNLWRVERFPDGRIKTYEFFMDREIWSEVSELKHWPEVPIWPIKRTQSLDWWRSVVKQAIWKALAAAGYHVLPLYQHIVKKSARHKRILMSIDKTAGSKTLLPCKPEMTPQQMADRMMVRYLGKEGELDRETVRYRWKDGLLTSASMEAGARALRAAIFQHIIEKEVFSAMLVMDYRNVPFLRYLAYAKYRLGLLKVAQERRNLLPLLPGINPEQWDRPDLFAKKLWIKGTRKTTLVDRSPFWSKDSTSRYASFDNGTGYRWLSKASPVVVKEWANCGKSTSIITNIALANVNMRVPVIAYQYLLRSSERNNFPIYGISPRIQSLYKLFLMNCSKLWETKGFVAVKQWLKADMQSNISTMMDYLNAEGFDEGYPDKQATWQSLVRRSDDWHARVSIANMERALAGQKLLEWDSLLTQAIIDEIIFTPLRTSRDMAIEGYEMHHCIGEYSNECHLGKYRAFSVVEPDGSRSTLGFMIKGKKTLRDQHMSKYNGAISDAAKAAGFKLIELYQQVLKSKNNKRLLHTA